jgi:hypothetical protein
MRYSSARQLTLNLDAAFEPTTGELGAPDIPAQAPVGTSSEPIRFPDDGYGPLYAATSRMAGLINAANISDEERDAFCENVKSSWIKNWTAP